MKHYQIWGLSYCNNSKGTNVLNGTTKNNWSETEDDVQIPCFDGIAFFKALTGRYYKSLYPKYRQLTADHLDDLNNNVGYYPNPGEYGPIFHTFGTIKEITAKEFKELQAEYPLKKKDIKQLS